MTSKFHLGHAFSEGMPEIKFVNGLPLADLIDSIECNPLDLTDDEIAERFEATIKELSDDDIELQAPYETDAKLAKVNSGNTISRKDYLLHSFASFVESHF